MNMKIIAFALLVSTALFASATPAECTWCPSYTCYSPCYSGCVCISQPGQVGGKCYGVQHAERLKAAGMTELR
jgi:hypothetical protein